MASGQVFYRQENIQKAEYNRHHKVGSVHHMLFRPQDNDHDFRNVRERAEQIRDKAKHIRVRIKHLQQENQYNQYGSDDDQDILDMLQYSLVLWPWGLVLHHQPSFINRSAST
jgi:translation initiation factor IF-3